MKMLANSMVVVVAFLASTSALGQEKITVGSLETPSFIANLKQFDEESASLLHVCSPVPMDVDDRQIFGPALKRLISTLADDSSAEDSIDSGRNSDFPSDLFELVAKSEDKSYAKRVATQILCQKVLISGQDLNQRPNTQAGSMLGGSLKLIKSKRIDTFDPDSADVSVNATNCYFSEFFQYEKALGSVCGRYAKENPITLTARLKTELVSIGEDTAQLYKKVTESAWRSFSCYFSDVFYDPNIVGSVCGRYVNENPGILTALLKKELKLNEKKSTELYEKLEKFAWSYVSEWRAAGFYHGTCYSCTHYEVQASTEFLVHQSLTLLATGKTLQCAIKQGWPNRPCDEQDFDDRKLSESKVATFSEADAQLNIQWRFLKAHAGADERWGDMLEAQRDWINMKLAVVEAASKVNKKNSESIHSFLTAKRAGQLEELRAEFLQK